jgi:peptidoglycan/LPS O-acetylase OafA/YrhL
LKYRAEIDGLRALAVVPVILFHAGFELFSGGFVGVDVFFVISGYLITTILIEDIENKRFSIIKFYERRARRILPALFVVIFASCPVAFLTFRTYDFDSFLSSVIATVLFVSNFYFWKNNGYFDPSSEETPLLHTWSLAVEEQYYVLFPLFLILAWRFGKNRVFWMIVVLASISLLISEWGWRNKATANFYLAPTRAWELFSGSIAAFIVHKQGVRKNNLLALVGLVAIIFSIFFYDENIPFPSVYALVPVLGVVLLVLHADKETYAAKLLSTKGFVGIGLISYSAYLWHQPIISFQVYLLNEINRPLTLMVVSIFAFCTWRFVETPIRKSKNRMDIFLLAIAVVVLLAIGLMFKSNDADINDINYQERHFHEALQNFGNHCQSELLIEVRCIASEGEISKPEILLLGDSHAEHLFPGLSSVLSDLTIVSLTTSGPPFIENLNQKGVINYIEKLNRPPRIIIFTMHYLGMLSALPIGSSFELEVEKVLEEFAHLNADILLISDVPRFSIHARRCETSLSERQNDRLCSQSRASHNLASYQYLRDLEGLADRRGLRLINIDELICDEKTCSMIGNNELLYRDTNHLTISGSLVVSQPISEAIHELLSD